MHEDDQERLGGNDEPEPASRIVVRQALVRAPRPLLQHGRATNVPVILERQYGERHLASVIVAGVLTDITHQM